MRVLLSPRCEAAGDAVASAAARALTGSDGEVSRLQGIRETVFRRLLTPGEIHSIRQALLGVTPEAFAENDAVPPAVVGYVCAGEAVAPMGEAMVVAVRDHVNLAWRSPLVGPNVDKLGPRFPVVARMYEPGVVLDRLALNGVGAVGGVVAGVRDVEHLLAFEVESARDGGMIAASSELVPVALLAAHLGIRLAAAVVIAGRS